MNGVLKAALVACMAIGPAISFTAAAQDGGRYNPRSEAGALAGGGYADRGYSDRGYRDRGYTDSGRADAQVESDAKHYRGDRYSGGRDWRHDRYNRHDRYASHYRAPVYRYGHTPGYFEVYPSYRYRAPARYVYPSGYRSYSWRTGHYLPRAYYAPTYYVDYRAYGLAPPPYGHHWVRVDNDVLLVALATGLVADVLTGIFY